VLANASVAPKRLLNAGCGAYEIARDDLEEVGVDLFDSPLAGRRLSVCASVTELPFANSTFGCVVCVGEVLGYCDPSRAIAEFGRIVAPSGLLICDFGSSLSFRYRFSETFGRAADIIIDDYNGAPEKVWVYNPEYILTLLSDQGFVVRSQVGTHCWSSIARRFGFSSTRAVVFEKWMKSVPLPTRLADLVTIVAVRLKDA
jgi:SAM-dependent methyltransferase